MPSGQLVDLVLLRGQDLGSQHPRLRRPALLEDRAGHLDGTQVMALHAGREAQVELASIQSGQPDQLAFAHHLRFGRCPRQSGVAWVEPQPERPTATPPWPDDQAAYRSARAARHPVRRWLASSRPPRRGPGRRTTAPSSRRRAGLNAPPSNRRDGVAVVAVAAREQERVQRHQQDGADQARTGQSHDGRVYRAVVQSLIAGCRPWRVGCGR